MPQFEDLFILPQVGGDAGRPRLLVVEHPDGWTLPRWTHWARHGRTGRELDDPFWPAAIQREIWRQLGIGVSVLHTDLYDEVDPATGDRRTVMVLENLSPDWSPPAGARWVGREELGRVVLAPWVPRAALFDWLSEAEVEAVGGEAEARVTGSQRASGRPPWQRPRWIQGALAWTEEQVQRHRLSVTGAPEQLGTKVGRCLLRVPTDAGRLYFKALPAMYARELTLLRLMSAEATGRVPEVLAMEVSRHWLLTRDHGGVPLTDAVGLGGWERVLEEFGRLQVRYVRRGSDLVAAGCTDLRPEVMATQIEPLLADGAALRIGQTGGLTADELAGLRSMAPDLREMCRRLAACAVPPSLVHGDFLPANVGLVDGAPVFVDWCEATFSHPFFSAVRFLLSARWRGQAIRDDPALYARMRDAYLQAWASFAPLANLIETWELASVLQPLAHALTYWHLLRLHLADGQAVDRWERRGAVALSLRRLLNQHEGLSPSHA